MAAPPSFLLPSPCCYYYPWPFSPGLLFLLFHVALFYKQVRLTVRRGGLRPAAPSIFKVRRLRHAPGATAFCLLKTAGKHTTHQGWITHIWMEGWREGYCGTRALKNALVALVMVGRCVRVYTVLAGGEMRWVGFAAVCVRACVCAALEAPLGAGAAPAPGPAGATPAAAAAVGRRVADRSALHGGGLGLHESAADLAGHVAQGAWGVVPAAAHADADAAGVGRRSGGKRAAGSAAGRSCPPTCNASRPCQQHRPAVACSSCVRSRGPQPPRQRGRSSHSAQAALT
jgi:hypothetical protein